jgi:hypothetical protein
MDEIAAEMYTVARPEAKWQLPSGETAILK